MGGSSVTSYEYTGAKIHKQGLGFLGFTTLVSKNSGTNRISTNNTTLDITAPYASYKPLLQENYSTISQSGKVLSSSIINFKNSRNQSVINAQIWYSYPDTITETNYLTGVSVTTTNDYNGDTNGNLYSTKKDFGGGFTETTLFEDYIGAGSYKPVNGIRFPNKPRKITVIKKHPDDPDPFTSQTLFTYNATNGNVLTKTENSNLLADKQVTTTYSNFDKFGNAQSVNTTGKSEGVDVNLTKTFVYEDLNPTCI